MTILMIHFLVILLFVIYMGKTMCIYVYIYFLVYIYFFMLLLLLTIINNENKII